MHGHQHQKEIIVPPSFIASSLFIPNTKTPTYSSFPLSSLAIWPLMLRRGKCSTKRFRFNTSALQSLKTKMFVSSTRVVAVTSLIWKCATTAARKLRGVDRQLILQIAVNIRGRLTPPVPRNAIGNIIWNAVAKCDANKRLSLDTMVGFVKDGIGKVDTRFNEKFKGENGSDNIIDEIQKLRSQMSSYDADYYSSSSLCNSGIYDADFGWGKPVWCCRGYLNNDVPLYANVILLMDTRNCDGVEAWVTLSQEEMERVECDPELLLYASVEPKPLQV